MGDGGGGGGGMGLGRVASYLVRAYARAIKLCEDWWILGYGKVGRFRRNYNFTVWQILLMTQERQLQNGLKVPF